jgi:hypothetical protein
MGQYQGEHTRRWADKIASFDGFVMVTPEYNHSTSGVRSWPPAAWLRECESTLRHHPTRVRTARLA